MTLEVVSLDSIEKERATERRALDQESRNSGLVGYAAVKYTATTIIVLGILYFIAVYVLPMFGG